MILDPALTQPCTLAEMLIAALQRHAGKPAFIDDERVITYAEIGERVGQAIEVFRTLGLVPGDAVVQLVGNRSEAFVIMMACYVHGLRSVALQTLGGEDDQAFIIDDAQARLVLVDATYQARGVALQTRCGQAARWFSHGPAQGFDDFWALARTQVAQPLVCHGGAEDVIRLAYTGGTTGRPKGVMLSNRSLVTYTLLVQAGIDWPQDVRLICTTPISHAAGSLILPTLLRGGLVVLQRGFDADAFIDAFERHRCNVTFLVPTLVYALLDHPRTRRTDWTEMHTLIYSAAPMAPVRVREALQVFGPCLVQLYGQTEAPNCVLALTQREHLLANDERLASAGRPLPGLSVALLDDTGQPVAANGGSHAIGEICVRGPLLMSGYWGQPELTAQAFEGGWLHTGDMAWRDAQGYLYIVDRKKDMIISGGFNVYPKEVENVLTAHPAVAAAAVIGVPDAKWGEAVKAFVTLRPGHSTDEATLIALVRRAKGAVHTPKSIELTETLPLTALGKIDKKALRARYWSGSSRGVN
ncbi:MAG: AMP-binding protein [Burkholderiales bacterium]